jgi:hypothetical protein
MREFTKSGVLALAMSLGVASWAGAQTLGEQERRADLAQLRSGFFERDRAYSAAARAQALARIEALEAESGDIDATRFALDLAQIAALADNGHTLSFAAARVARANRVPIRHMPFGTEFVVMRALEPHLDLLGARLQAIDGVPLARLREAAHRLSGGVPAYRDRQAPFLFESPQQLNALGLGAAAGEAMYRFVLADGRSVERRLAGQPPGADRPRANTGRLLLPEVGAGMGGWQGVLALERAPWSLQEALKRFRWQHRSDLDAVVIDLRQIFDGGDEKLADFFEVVREAVRRLQPRHLVLDLRLNGGGDLTRARDFAESLPTLVPGRLFVLTGPGTFSAAISTLGYLKQAAPARVSIVGEAVGDRLEFFAEGREIKLRHSGESLLPATERHDYVSGCRKFDDCHIHVVRRPIAVPTLDPDIAAPWTFEAYRAGVDPAMQAVAAALKR